MPEEINRSMQETLIEKGFLVWLNSLDIAPYAVMFFDIPKIVQYSYIQKWLREVHGVDVFILRKAIFQQKHKYTYEIVKKFDLCLETLNYDTYEEALEIGLQEALKLI